MSNIVALIERKYEETVKSFERVFDDPCTYLDLHKPVHPNHEVTTCTKCGDVISDYFPWCGGHDGDA